MIRFSFFTRGRTEGASHTQRHRDGNRAAFPVLLMIGMLLTLPRLAAAGTGLQGTGGGTPAGPTLFTFQPGGGPLNSGPILGTPTAVITADGGSVYFTSPVFAAGGNFVVRDAGSAALLQGDFSALQQFALNSTSLFASFDVTYTGGSELAQAGLVPGDRGTLGLTLSGVQPGSGPGPQTASEYGISFDAAPTPAPAPVPEPSGLATFAVAGLGLAGLACAGRRRAKRS